MLEYLACRQCHHVAAHFGLWPNCWGCPVIASHRVRRNGMRRRRHFSTHTPPPVPPAEPEVVEDQPSSLVLFSDGALVALCSLRARIRQGLYRDDLVPAKE